VRLVLEEVGRAGRARYVERATMANQKIVALDQVEPMSSPYFSLIIVPGDSTLPPFARDDNQREIG